MRSKKPKINKGISFSRMFDEFGLASRSVYSLINKGDLKLNDYNKIDEEYYLKFKKEWENKPDWMKKK